MKNSSQKKWENRSNKTKQDIHMLSGMRFLAIFLTLTIFSLQSIAADKYNEGVGLLGSGNYAAAFTVFDELAKAGDADAQSNLGAMYEHGHGVTASFSEAAKWYRASAIQGNIVAQYNLASLLYYGKGVSRDRSAAIAWAMLAEAGGLKEATPLIDALVKRMNADELANGYLKFREFNAQYGFRRTTPRPFRIP